MKASGINAKRVGKTEIMGVGASIFTKIQDTTLSERASRQIQQLILESQLKPGDKLPTEKTLGEEFGVSRTVVREAIRQLVAKGLLDVSPGRGGTTIRQPTSEDTTESMMLYLSAGRGGLNYEKVLEVRRELEVGIAGLAARRRTAEDLKELEALLQPLITAGGTNEFVKRDSEFHAALARATHNEIFVLLIGSLNEWMVEMRRKTYEVLRRNPSMSKHHWLIYEKVKAGDEAGARRAMIAHLDEAEEIQRAAMKLPKMHNRMNGKRAKETRAL